MVKMLTKADGSISGPKVAGAAAAVASVGGLIGWWFTRRYYAKVAAEMAEANERAIAELQEQVAEIRHRKPARKSAKTARKSAKTAKTAKKVTKALAGA